MMKKIWYKLSKHFTKDDEIFNKIMKNVGVLLSGDVIASVVNVVTLAIIVRTLGLENYGVMILIQTYSQTIDKLLNFQSWQAFIKFGSEALDNNDIKKFKGYIKQGFILDISTAFLGAIVSFVAVDAVSNFLSWDSNVVILAKIYSLGILFNIAGTPIGILRLYNQFKVFSYNKIWISISKLVVVLAAYLFSFNFSTFIILNLIIEIMGYLILLAVSLRVIRENGNSSWWKSNDWRSERFLEFTIYSNLTSTFDIPVKQLDVFIIQAVLTTELVGVYKVLKQIVSIFSKLLDPVYQAVFPPLAKLCAQKNYDEARGIVFKIGLIMLSVGSVISIFASSTAYWWLPLFFGDEMRGYALLLTLYLAIKVISNTFVGLHPYFIAIGNIKLNVLILLVSNAIYLYAAWELGQLLGLLGLIIAYGIQSLIGVILKIIILFTQNKKVDDSEYENYYN